MGLWAILTGRQPGPLTSFLHYQNKGQFGEFCTAYALNSHHVPGEFYVLENIYLPMKQKTTELDVVMIHERGIYVFECKNYSGWIFGDSDALKWTETFPDGSHHQFYNPIRQNQTHMRVLGEFLGVPSSVLHSYIVFSDQAVFKKISVCAENTFVVHQKKLLSSVCGDLQTHTQHFSHEELISITNRLDAFCNVTEEEKAQHVSDIYNRCPYCGNPLVLRQGRYGPFLGCSTYPRCRYTRNL